MSPQNRNILIGVIVGLLVLGCCCLAVTIGVVVADPFGWHLLSGFAGQADPIASAAPAGAPVYAAVDLKALTSAKVARVLKAFADVPGGSDYSSPDQAIKQLDQNLDKQLGLTFTGDIQPWLSGNAGLVVAELPAPGSSSQGAFVLIVEARDTKKADAFIAKFIAAVAKNSNNTPSETDYQGVTLHTLAPGSSEPGVIARSKKLVLLANSETAVQDVIQAQTGKIPALASSADFKQMRGQLPGGGLLTLFIGGPSLETFVKDYQNSPGGLGANITPAQAGLDAVRSVALELSAVDQGLRLDTAVAFDEQKLTDAQRQMFTARLDETASRLLPENTLGYVAGQGLDQAWANYRAGMDPNDFKDMLSSFEKQYGFNPETALFPYLKGNWLLALVPDPDSIVAQGMSSGDYGFVGLAETNNPTALSQTIETFNAKLEDSGATIDARTIGKAQAYVLGSQGKTMAVYGLGQGHLALASSEKVFTDIFDQNKTLADAGGYQQVWRAFPGNTQRIFYADVAGIVKLARDSLSGNQLQSFDKEAAPYLKPVESVALGSLPLKNGLAQSTLIVFIASQP